MGVVKLWAELPIGVRAQPGMFANVRPQYLDSARRDIWRIEHAAEFCPAAVLSGWHGGVLEGTYLPCGSQTRGKLCRRHDPETLRLDVASLEARVMTALRRAQLSPLEAARCPDVELLKLRNFGVVSLKWFRTRYGYATPQVWDNWLEELADVGAIPA
jgi:hypothetical protein